MGFADKYIVPKLIDRDYNKIVETYQNNQDSAESGYLQKELELYPIMDLIDSLDKNIKGYQNADYYNKITSYKNDLNNLQNIVNKYGVKSVDKNWVYDLHRKYSDDVLPILGAVQKKEKMISDYITGESSGKHWLDDPRNIGIQSFVDDAYKLPTIVDKNEYARDLQTAYQELADQDFTPSEYKMWAGVLPVVATQYGASPSQLLDFIENSNNPIIPEKLRKSLLTIHKNINKAYGIAKTDEVLDGIVVSSLFKALGKKDYSTIPSSLYGGDGDDGENTVRYSPMDALSVLDAEDAAIFNSLVYDGNLNMSNDFIKDFENNTLHVGDSYNTSSEKLQNAITGVYEALGKSIPIETLFKYYTDDNYKSTEDGKKIQKAIEEYENKHVKILNDPRNTKLYPNISGSTKDLLRKDKNYREKKEVQLYEKMSGKKINPYTTIDDIRNGLMNIKNPIDYGAYQDYRYALFGEALTNVYNIIFTGMRNSTKGVNRGIFKDTSSNYSINITAKDDGNEPIYSKDDILDIRYNPIQNKMYAIIRDKENKNNATVTIDISSMLPVQDKNTMQMIQNIINNKELSIEDKRISVSKLLNSLLSTSGNGTGTNNVK